MVDIKIDINLIVWKSAIKFSNSENGSRVVEQLPDYFIIVARGYLDLVSPGKN